MLRLALACSLALTLLAAAPVAQAAPKRPKPCPGAKGSVARTLQTSVYVRVRDDADYTMYGCHLRTRRRTAIDAWFSCGCSIADEYPPQLWLSGRFVAVNHNICSPISPSECFGTLSVFDLRSRRRTQRVDSGGSIGGLVLKPNGSLAYVRGSLVRIDSSGTTTLDPGPGIDESSLATDGRRLYWLRDGAPQVAPFN